jgi:hypothetical protein
MFAKVLGGKWWMGLVAGVCGVLGAGTAMVAIPAFADNGRAPNFKSDTLTGVGVRLECKKGNWDAGSFTWTLDGAPVGSPVALPTCPEADGDRVITLPNITLPVTGAATTAVTGSAAVNGFRINVAGKSESGIGSAACTLVSPDFGSSSKDLRRRQLNFTCSADGGSKQHQAFMRVKAKAIVEDRPNSSRVDDADDQQGQAEEQHSQSQEQQDQAQSSIQERTDQRPVQALDQPKDKSEKKVNSEAKKPGQDREKNKGKNDSGGKKGGWWNIFSRGRDS